jgi:hypothetical protein
VNMTLPGEFGQLIVVFWVIYAVIAILIHVLFAIAVFQDATRLAQRQLPPVRPTLDSAHGLLSPQESLHDGIRSAQRSQPTLGSRSLYPDQRQGRETVFSQPADC